MKFTCVLYVVNDIKKSRAFYENLLNQRVKYDFGENITFESGFAIQEKDHFSNMVSVDKNDIIFKANNSELYFETDDIENFIHILDNSAYDISFLHNLREHSWGQRVIRFYDLDGNIIEVGENMNNVITRLLSEGKSIKEVSEKTQHSYDFIKKIYNDKLN